MPEYLTIDHLSLKVIKRLFKQIRINPDTGCWEWVGRCRKSRTYGRTMINGRLDTAHRVMYAWLVEPIPRGFGLGIPTLDHVVCQNPCCCFPAHLELVPHRTNVLRGTGPTAENAKKTHCKRGHLLPETPNDPAGRRCITCSRAGAKRRYNERLNSEEHDYLLEQKRRNQRKHAAKNGEAYKERKKAYMKKWRLENQERIQQQRHDYWLKRGR